MHVCTLDSDARRCRQVTAFFIDRPGLANRNMCSEPRCKVYSQIPRCRWIAPVSVHCVHKEPYVIGLLDRALYIRSLFQKGHDWLEK